MSSRIADAAAVLLWSGVGLAFWRRRAEPAGWTGPFAPEEYRAFVKLIAFYFGVRKVPITIHESDLTIEAADGPRREHLGELAARCHGEARERWPELIATHFAPPADPEAAPAATAAPGAARAEAGPAPAAEGGWPAFRGLVEECFRRYGFDASVEADGVVARDASGEERRFEAPGLERGPLELAREEWPLFVDGFFGEWLRALRGRQALAGYRYEDVRGRLAVQLFDETWLSAAASRAAVLTRDLPGLASALVCRLPQATFRLPPDMLAVWGRERDEVMETALANLRRLRPPLAREPVGAGVEGMRFEAPGPFAAAQALGLADYAECGGPYGALVAVPRRELLLVCPLKAVPDAARRYTAAATGLVTRILRSEWEGHAALSRRLYWYRGGRFGDLPYQVQTGDGRPAIEFTPEGELAAALAEMERAAEASAAGRGQ